MKPYCQDLRKRVLAQAKSGIQTQAHIAATFGVSLSTVEKWLRQKRETGQTTPLPPAHGPKRVLQDYAPLIRAEVQNQPDITLCELSAVLARRTGMKVSPSTLCRELQRLRLPRKKSRYMLVSATRRASVVCAAGFGNGSPRNGAHGSVT